MLARALLRNRRTARFRFQHHKSWNLVDFHHHQSRTLSSLLQRQREIIYKRRFCTKSKNDEKIEIVKKWRPVITRGAYIGIGCITAYVVSKGAMNTTNWFLSIKPHTYIWYGFLSGFVSASICGVLMYVARRTVTIRPENVYRMSKSLVEKNDKVNQRLGHYMEPGKLKAYKIDGGNFSVRPGTFIPMYKPPRVQMLYNMFGAQSKEGMVSVEAEKINGRLVMKLVVVDVGSDMILVTGMEDRMKVAGQLRGFLQTERVKYLKQDVIEEDDEVPPLIE